MSDDKDDLKSIEVYKYDNTKESWHEFTLRFRVIAERRGNEEIIDDTKNPPDEKEDLEILDKDNVEKKRQKEKSWQPEWPTKRVSETW